MNKNYLITKSNYFIMNSSYDLSLQEQKIILTLASMVQPDDEEFRPYKFKIADFMELVGIVDKSKYIEIPKITKELMKKVFEIEEGKTLIQTAWLSGVRYEKGSGMVTLKFNPDLKPYMLKLSSMFTQYKLANILNMKSKYSIRMYEILKANEFKKQGYIDIEIEELRKLVKAENVYPLYNDLKRFIIERTQKELKKLSDISFDYKEIKTGRKVTSIKFYITSSKSNSKREVAVTLAETKPKPQQNIDAIKLVKEIIKEEISDIDAQNIFSIAKGDINIIKEKYEFSKTAAKIDNLVGWLMDAIKKDYKPAIGKVKVDKFNDYEKKLLGWQ